LDLPPELRCMVYEYLQVTTRRHEMDLPEDEYIRGAWECRVTLVPKHLPVVILAVWHLIRNKALPYLEPKLTVLRDRNHSYIATDYMSFWPLSIAKDSLASIFNQRKKALASGADIVMPTEFIVSGNRFLQGSVDYKKIDEFTRRLAALCASGFPRTTTAAVKV
jgi:hypothetical protein